MEKIIVIVIDDSTMVRKVFSEQLAKDQKIEVVGAVTDPYISRDKIVYFKPGVVILDIEMPKMDGLTFLEKLMKYLSKAGNCRKFFSKGKLCDSILEKIPLIDESLIKTIKFSIRGLLWAFIFEKCLKHYKNIRSSFVHYFTIQIKVY